jgi:hypothetical protein
VQRLLGLRPVHGVQTLRSDVDAFVRHEWLRRPRCVRSCRLRWPWRRASGAKRADQAVELMAVELGLGVEVGIG